MVLIGQFGALREPDLRQSDGEGCPREVYLLYGTRAEHVAEVRWHGSHSTSHCCAWLARGHTTTVVTSVGGVLVRRSRDLGSPWRAGSCGAGFVRWGRAGQGGGWAGHRLGVASSMVGSGGPGGMPRARWWCYPAASAPVSPLTIRTSSPTSTPGPAVTASTLATCSPTVPPL